MKRRFHWRDAELAAASLRESEGDRRTLLLLARLPFVYAEVLTRLGGLRGGASVYRSLEGLKEAGLVRTIRLPWRPGLAPRLCYLSDLGVATVAVDQGCEPEHLARRNGLRGHDLLAMVPGLPQLVAAYELLGLLATARPGQPHLLAWERPWRRRYQRPSAKAPVAVTLPAYAALAWESAAGAYLLLPDLGGTPLRLYRAALDHLLALRGPQSPGFPALVVATMGSRREAAWGDLIEEVRRARRDAPLAARVTTWDELREGARSPNREPEGTDPGALASLGAPGSAPGGQLLQPLGGHPLGARRPTALLPELVGDALATPSPPPAEGALGRAALGLGPVDRALLDLIGRHPFLPLCRLAELRGWGARWTRQRRDRLIGRGLMRLAEASEVGAEAAASELVELTAEGLALVAAGHGLSLAQAVRHLDLAGGGPRRPIGSRRKLLASLAHTLGADAVFVNLASTARRLAALGSDDELLEWRNAAACSRGHLRPDGYGLYRHAGQIYGFFLEYDRGTMSARDFLAKFAAYHDYLASGRFQRDYQGFPTVLVVTSDNSAEERIARAVRASAVGRGQVLPLLLTCQWRLADARNPLGLLGPVWREPNAAFHDRRFWLLDPSDSFVKPARMCRLRLSAGEA